jgi:DNA invertase Pin-like site-specific DNA recombinase
MEHNGAQKILKNPLGHLADPRYTVRVTSGYDCSKGVSFMKQQPTAAGNRPQVAPYQFEIPDYRKGEPLPDSLTVLYCRLSRDDKDKEKEDDSNSIINQKKILGNYAREQRLPNPVFFVDDGVSGTTFDREQFSAAITLVEAGRVPNFIVKDMSRFGRDYLKVGFYTEVLFPDMDVRFVALYDNVDSTQGENDLTPFRNIMNEWYARDTSKKIRAVFRAKGMAGEHLSTNVLYGYKHDPNDKKRWVIDEEAAEIVRKIFQWSLAGLGITHIAQKLTEMKVDTPTHHALKLGVNPAGLAKGEPWEWSSSVIAKILARREYLGQTINFKTYRRSYKHKKKLENDPSEYVVFEDTQEAIVDRETFDRVQALREQGKRRHNSSGRLGLFSGLAFCADCKSRMYLSSGSCLKPEQDNYVCSGFRTKKQVCDNSHYIRRVVLERSVLEHIQYVTDYAAEHESGLVELLRQNDADKSRKELVAAKRKLTQAQNRISELDHIIQRLYEDKVAGILTDERFVKLSRGYEQEQADLTVETATLAEKVAAQEQQTLDLSRFLTQVRKYTKVTELTPTMLNELVERIEIHAPDKSSGKRTQQVDVYFNHVGIIGKLDFAQAKSGEPKPKAEAGGEE